MATEDPFLCIENSRGIPEEHFCFSRLSAKRVSGGMYFGPSRLIYRYRQIPYSDGDI
jgi:hypothetical protein